MDPMWKPVAVSSERAVGLYKVKYSSPLLLRRETFNHARRVTFLLHHVSRDGEPTPGSTSLQPQCQLMLPMRL
jgi:hypothetical protein